MTLRGTMVRWWSRLRFRHLLYLITITTTSIACYRLMQDRLAEHGSAPAERATANWYKIEPSTLAPEHEPQPPGNEEKSGFTHHPLHQLNFMTSSNLIKNADKKGAVLSGALGRVSVATSWNGSAMLDRFVVAMNNDLTMICLASGGKNSETFAIKAEEILCTAVLAGINRNMNHFFSDMDSLASYINVQTRNFIAAMLALLPKGSTPTASVTFVLLSWHQRTVATIGCNRAAVLDGAHNPAWFGVEHVPVRGNSMTNNPPCYPLTPGAVSASMTFSTLAVHETRHLARIALGTSGFWSSFPSLEKGVAAFLKGGAFHGLDALETVVKDKGTVIMVDLK